MIPDSKFPDLASDKAFRVTGFFMAHEMAGQIKEFTDPSLVAMLRAFFRMVDGIFIDYQAARQSYYQFYQDENLGGSLPISIPLVAMLHHIENCLSNLERVREMADAIRIRKPVDGIASLIEKNDWKIAEVHEGEISNLRNAIQHRHNDLKRGVDSQGAIKHQDTGHITLGSNSLALSDLAETLLQFQKIARKMIEALIKST